MNWFLHHIQSQWACAIALSQVLVHVSLEHQDQAKCYLTFDTMYDDLSNELFVFCKIIKCICNIKNTNLYIPSNVGLIIRINKGTVAAFFLVDRPG